MKKLIFAAALLLTCVGCGFGQVWLSNTQKVFSGCEIYQLENDNKFIIRNKQNEVFLVTGNGNEEKNYVVIKIFSSQFNPNGATPVVPTVNK